MRLIGPESWMVTKPAKTGAGGIVACAHGAAAAAGVEILEQGGNAVDAAVATALALAVVEPWMSGLGGFGYLVAAEAKGARGGGVEATVVDFGPRIESDSAAGAPGVVPGMVDGLGLALERLGRSPFAAVAAPAIRLAADGVPVDWPATQAIAGAAAALSRDPAAAARFLVGGLPPVPAADGAVTHLPNPALAATLSRLAASGPRDFYEGAVAADLAADLAAAGVAIGAAELAGYEARFPEPLSRSRQGVTLYGPAAGTAVSLVFAALDGIAQRIPAIPMGYPDGEVFVAYAESLRAIHRAHPDDGRSGGEAATHVSVVDRQGMMVALSLGLGPRFGARLLLPRTGILLNGALAGHDPALGRRLGALPLAPVVAVRDGQPWFALGAGGGRRIVSAVTQLASMLVDFSMSLDSAFATPRLDAADEPILVDAAMPADDLETVLRLLPARAVGNRVEPALFGLPVAVMREPELAINAGITHARAPNAVALMEGEIW